MQWNTQKIYWNTSKQRAQSTCPFLCSAFQFRDTSDESAVPSAGCHCMRRGTLWTGLICPCDGKMRHSFVPSLVHSDTSNHIHVYVFFNGAFFIRLRLNLIFLLFSQFNFSQLVCFSHSGQCWGSSCSWTQTPKRTYVPPDFPHFDKGTLFILTEMCVCIDSEINCSKCPSPLDWGHFKTKESTKSVQMTEICSIQSAISSNPIRFSPKLCQLF